MQLQITVFRACSSSLSPMHRACGYNLLEDSNFKLICFAIYSLITTRTQKSTVLSSQVLRYMFIAWGDGAGRSPFQLHRFVATTGFHVASRRLIFLRKNEGLLRVL